MAITVETLVYSGQPNPTFVVATADEPQFAALAQARMAAAPVVARPTQQLGYRGFSMEPQAALGLPPLLIVGQGLVVGETDGVTRAWADTGGQCEQWLKERAREAGQAEQVDSDLGAPVPPDVIRPEGRRLGLADELLAGALDFARNILAQLEAAALIDVPSFAAAAGGLCGRAFGRGSVKSRPDGSDSQTWTATSPPT